MNKLMDENTASRSQSPLRTLTVSFMIFPPLLHPETLSPAGAFKEVYLDESPERKIACKLKVDEDGACFVIEDHGDLNFEKLIVDCSTFLRNLLLKETARSGMLYMFIPKSNSCVHHEDNRFDENSMCEIEDYLKMDELKKLILASDNNEFLRLSHYFFQGYIFIESRDLYWRKIVEDVLDFSLIHENDIFKATAEKLLHDMSYRYSNNSVMITRKIRNLLTKFYKITV